MTDTEHGWSWFLENNTKFILPLDYIRDIALEEPGDSPVLMAKFGNKVMPENATDFMPFFGTDIGWCSLIKPQGYSPRLLVVTPSPPFRGHEHMTSGLRGREMPREGRLRGN